MWEDPGDPRHHVLAAQLASRWPRERLYHEICDDAGIIVSSTTGRCERDSVKLVNDMYSNFQRAMRDTFTSARPAQPFLYIDGTGGSLGKGIAHTELGTADFANGAKQSRATLSPLALFEGSDHGESLRENMPLVAQSYNALIKSETITRHDGSSIPSRPGAAADMQAVKALAAQQERSHTPWCKCSGDQQHKYGSADLWLATWAEVLTYIREVGCEFREEEWMCRQSHYSYGVHRGGKFTKINCSCGYDPSERKWRSDMAAYHIMTNEEQAEVRRLHNELGAHFLQVLFMTPLLHLDMWRIGVDQLHLVYLNFFKHLFRGTIHETLPTLKKQHVRSYLREAGFYSYDATSDDEDPVKWWIGREVPTALFQCGDLTLHCSRFLVKDVCQNAPNHISQGAHALCSSSKRFFSFVKTTA